VCIDSDIVYIINGLRPVRSGVTNKTLLIGHTPSALFIYPNNIRIKPGSRILVDNRHDYHPGYASIEIVDTGKDSYPIRVHIWKQQSYNIVNNTLSITEPTYNFDHYDVV